MSKDTMPTDELLREVLKKAFYVDPITDELFFGFREDIPLSRILGIGTHTQLRAWMLENRRNP